MPSSAPTFWNGSTAMLRVRGFAAAGTAAASKNLGANARPTLSAKAADDQNGRERSGKPLPVAASELAEPIPHRIRSSLERLLGQEQVDVSNQRADGLVSSAGIDVHGRQAEDVDRTMRRCRS